MRHGLTLLDSVGLRLTAVTPLNYSGWIRSIVLSLFMVSPCFSQTKVQVLVNHYGEDTVGKNYAFYMKEAIRGSASFELSESGLTTPRIVLNIVTLDISSTNSGNASAIAVSIAYDSLNVPHRGLLLDTTAQVCGSSRAKSCAEGMLPTIDANITRLRDGPATKRYWLGLRTGDDLLRQQPAPAPRPSPTPPARAVPENPF